MGAGSKGDGGGSFKVEVISDDIKATPNGEGNHQPLHWRWGTKVWGANGIRDPGSPYGQRWMLTVEL